MHRKVIIPLIFSFLFIFLLPGLIYALSYGNEVTFPGLWENAKEILYSGYDLWDLDYSDTSSPLLSLRKGIIDTSLPGGSHLTVRGRKVIGIKYTRFDYLDPEAAEDKPTSTTEIEQELQIQARGKVGEKISVNVDYDDTAPRAQQQKINLLYRGDKNEVIKEVALGDIHLALPKTQFTSYSRSLFGARLKARWGNLHLTGIGSVTKGISEVKTFTGKTTTQKKEIPDTGYIKRTYFKIFFDEDYPPPEEGFSYTPGSLEVWIDDQDGANNISGQTVYMQVSGVDADTYTGYFDPQYPGQDYTVDSLKGVIKFNKNLGENYVIAISYKDANGNPHPAAGEQYMIMKGTDERYFKYRFWDYYYLGSDKISQDDFTFQIKDLSGNIVYDWESPESWNYQVSIDFDFGIVQVFKPPTSSEDYYYPFFSEDELPTPPHRYTLYTSYTHPVDVYLLHPDMVPDSERVYVDGKLLTKGEDYTIDYASGFLSFLRPELIGPDTKIRVEYEWMPLMGGQATFLGARLEYTPGKNFSLGSSFLSQAAPSAGKIPSFGSSPASHQVWEADLNFDFNRNVGSLWGGNFPVGVLFAGEISRSNVNPNTFGSSMLDDFSSSKVEDLVSLGEDNWSLGSRPLTVDDEFQESRDGVNISDEKLKGEEVNPLWSSDEIKVLTLTYDFSSGSNWDAVVYSLSQAGKDYSNMKYLEVWTKGVTGSVEVHLDVGVVSEDVDEDGRFDTEDENGDGVLNPGEDKGIYMNFPSYFSDEEAEIVGAGNGRLDTEDLDGDGVLDTNENFCTYLLSEEYKQQVPGSGWYKYTIPLSDAVNWSSVRSLVKHIRIWAQGSDFSGTVKFAKIGISGDRWKIENLEVKGVNNYDDIYEGFPDPFDSSEFRSYYERMFGDTKTSQGKWQKESFLRLTSTSGEDSGYIQQTFLSAKNFSDYRQINFWIYVEENEGAEGEFYIRFGSDVDASYYEYILPLSSASTQRWTRISVSFSNLDTAGTPTFGKINQLRIGLKGLTYPVCLYMNDIYLDRVYERKGQAQRYFLRTSFSKYFTLSGEYKKIAPPFSVVGGSSTNQKLELKKWGISSSFLDFLPFSYSRSKKFTSTQTTRGTDLEPVEEEKVSKTSQSYHVGFRVPRWPTLSFKGSNVESDYLSKEPEERTFEDIYNLSLNYPVPLKFPLLPTNISCSLQLKKSGKKVEGNPSSRDITRKGSLTMPFHPLPNLILKTSYSQSETNHRVNEEEGKPKSRSKGLSLTSRFSIFNLTPRVDFKGGYSEGDFFSFSPEKRKVSTHLDSSLNLPLRPAAFIRMPDVLSNLGWYLSFNLKTEGIYEDTSVLLDLPSQFGLRRLDIPDGREKLWLEKTSFNLRQSWRPFSFLSTSISYGKEEENKVESGTPYRIKVKSWPVAELRFNLRETPLLASYLFGKFFSSSSLVLGYSEKNTLKEKISTTTSYQPSVNWRGVFKKPEALSLTYSYTSSTKKERSFGAQAASTEFSSTHKLGLGWSTYIPWGRRIPILNRLINFKNRVDLSAALSRELNYKETASNVVKQDQEKWTLGTNISYKMADNINMKMGLSLTYYEDRVKVGEDYLSYTGSARVEILF